MHKQLANEAILRFALRADGPILIKAGESGGLDPTHPDMEFVRTRGQVFLPGSSLKGVLRAHAERIIRSLNAEGPGDGRGACDPLKRGEACGDRLERLRLESDEKYRRSCFICRLFGNTVVAGRTLFADALPQVDDDHPLGIDERNGVAIDRIFGSVAVGPFNYEVVTEGTFPTQILMRNFTLPQLALLGLALRDLGEGRVALGFGKSRGLGRVGLEWRGLELRYPMALLRPGSDVLREELRGVGSLVAEKGYGFPTSDVVPLPAGLRFQDDGWGTLHLKAEGDAVVQDLFRAAFPRWRAEVLGG